MMNSRDYQAASQLLNRLLPHHCPICDDVRSSYGLCEACWTDLTIIASPLCEACGRPLPAHHLSLDDKSKVLCGTCLKQRPILRRQRSILRYDETSKALILPFKHGSRLDYTPLLARMMLSAFSSLMAECDFVFACASSFHKTALSSIQSISGIGAPSMPDDPLPRPA